MTAGLAYGASASGLASDGDSEVAAILLRSAEGAGAAGKAETSYTPATSLFAGLAAALDYVRQMGDGDLAAGRRALVENAELCAAMTRAGVSALGLQLFAGSSPAAALTAVAAPPGTDSTAICKRFRDQFGAVVANGQAEMKGQLFRIAHIGYYDYLDTVGVLAALEVVSRRLRAGGEFGSVVRAAEVYGRGTATAEGR
jgi:aspartate aminotransferase-like enzyme